VHKLSEHQQYNRQLAAAHLYFDALKNNPQRDGVPRVCIVDTFPHPAPLLVAYEPKSKSKMDTSCKAPKQAFNFC